MIHNHIRSYTRRWSAIAALGEWYFAGFRRNVAEAGLAQASRNLRKRGVPLALALRLVRAL